ncbi:ImmA/IrrE family metallo-endopeptidase [Staphylococcus xylosus]|uniref:ImmA/IrrE family metallo-endopeptidase n=1 Tax=Staphylococcus xylosus TaxID=1288 RepID=UPI001C3EA196|nr:ImmA/IrrE family metallo-endopeptidase [Staphylococcus xylosus]
MEETYRDTIKRIKPIADAYVKQNNIQHPIKNSTQLLSEMDYYIIKAQAPKNLSGFYMKKDKFPFIFVNTNHSLGRQNFSLWHEVYHHYMNHQNGISDFGSNVLEEREAEIFAGCVLLPDTEIQKWMAEEGDVMRSDVLSRMSVYYNMSFNGVMVRAMQLNPIPKEKYKALKMLSNVDQYTKLHVIYTENNLEIDILKPTYDIQISPNIMTVLKNNYSAGLVSANKINEIIEKIEVLNNEQ